MQRLILILTALLLAGCATVPPLPVPVPNAGVHGQVRGLFCGLVKTSPNGDNPCPGCDIDALTLATDAQAEGVRGVLLLNEQCTWTGIKAAALALADGLTRGDMLVITLSGHGGQLADDNYDEPDGIDEALILWAEASGDTMTVVRDDRVMVELLERLWDKVPGLDILLITDTCFSQGNFRALWGKLTLSQPQALRVALGTRAVDGGLVQIAMCREDEYSWGGGMGGTGTQTLLAVRQAGLGRLATFMALQAAVKGQAPQWTEFAAVSEMFRNGEFWR